MSFTVFGRLVCWLMLTVIVVFVNSEVGVGRSSTEPLRGGQLPEVLTTEQWDGKDGEV